MITYSKKEILYYGRHQDESRSNVISRKFVLSIRLHNFLNDIFTRQQLQGLLIYEKYIRKTKRLCMKSKAHLILLQPAIHVFMIGVKLTKPYEDPQHQQPSISIIIDQEELNVSDNIMH